MQVFDGFFALSETARAKWGSLTSIEREAVEQTFLAVLQDPSKGLHYGFIEVTQRFDQGFRTYKALLVESEDYFFAWGAWETKGTQVPVVLDIVRKGDVCILAH